jgi:phosphate transport system substrate-binding protein
MQLPTARTLATAAALAAAFAATPALGEARDAVRIVGSSTVYPFSSAVAEHFGKGGKFKTPVVESTGTGGGFKLFCTGVGVDTPDINDASRPMTDAEKGSCAGNGVAAVSEFRIGYDGIVVAATKGASFDLTREQLYLAVAKTVVVGGKLVPNPYKSWSDIDPKLPKHVINVLGPAPNHGTRDAFLELVMDPGCEKFAEIKALAKDEMKKTCQTVREDGAWTDVAADYAVIMGKLKSDKNAVGVFTFSYVDQNRDKIQAAKVDGIAPSLETISSSQYPISRPLFIYVKKAHVGVIPGLGEFVQEFVSEKAGGKDGYLVDKGLVPMPAKELKAQQAAAKALSAK